MQVKSPAKRDFLYDEASWNVQGKRVGANGEPLKKNKTGKKVTNCSAMKTPERICRRKCSANDSNADRRLCRGALDQRS
jgi:hypothetical protein